MHTGYLILSLTLMKRTHPHICQMRQVQVHLAWRVLQMPFLFRQEYPSEQNALLIAVQDHFLHCTKIVTARHWLLLCSHPAASIVRIWHTCKDGSCAAAGASRLVWRWLPAPWDSHVQGPKHPELGRCWVRWPRTGQGRTGACVGESADSIE